ncbi:ganglioside GM2 activator-like [Centruroides sculpturatus]|uniref:ganglioside GM2 activator-like n=1 Tax=Centruroides sculpturatus TaxID=218467 RepID=UPI000C6CFEBF|nr:ganglioside GM2 activator-like [Centruroides sculpturatus]XP_023213812.1 ganglioside GM2 activator-like [Centruroides sculpturatus]
MNYITLILSVTSLCQILPANAYDTNKVNSSSWHPISKRDSSIEWESCNDDAPVKVKSFSLTPNPIPVRGTITVGGDIVVDRPIDSPIMVTAEIYREILFWIHVKHINLGNLCEMFPTNCAKEHDLLCICPIKAKSYSIPSVKFQLPDFSVSDFLATGYYRATVKGSHCGSQLFCYNVYFLLRS